MFKIKWTKGRLTMVVFLWIAIILLAFYGYFWRYIQTFDHRGLYPDGQVNNAAFVTFVEQQLGGVASNQLETLVFHWLDPSCFCTVYSGNTVDKLKRETQNSTLRHIVLTPPGKKADLNGMLPVLENVEVVELNLVAYEQSSKLIPASPAAMIYNKKAGTLSYLGPHSSGVVCGKGTGFVELVLNNLSHGFDPLLYELEQSGCFCSWGD